MSTCVACNTTDDIRGINLPRGSFTLCRACRAEWEGQMLGTPDDRAMSFDVADLRDSVLFAVYNRISAEHKRRDAPNQARTAHVLNPLRAGGER